MSLKTPCVGRKSMKRRKEEDPKTGMTRRSFIKGVGVSAAAAAAASGALSAVADAEAKEAKAEEMQKVTLRVNGRSHRLLVEPRWSLLFVLRERMGLTGTKVGCERGECGACTVLINGVPRYACMTLALEAEGDEITTVEGLMVGEELGTVQKAFMEHDAFQCGYCTPGQIMAAEGLLRTGVSLNIGEIQKGMSGNLCRCGAYAHIFQAVEAAAKARSGK
jgi:xanthine dehydrogenase YagT iron-sulfur-binding subunit